MQYWVVRQGTGGVNAKEMIEAGYLGVDFIGSYDIREHLGAGSDAFRAVMNGIYQELNPGVSRGTAGLAMGNLHAACATITEGDIVLAPKPDRTCEYGTVAGGYEYHPGTALPHRRRVDWKGSFSRDDMSPGLARSTGTRMTVFQLADHKVELAHLTSPSDTAQPIVEAVLESEVEERLAFQMEKQLEDFLVHNWRSTPLGREYDIHEVDGIGGQQFPTDTGPMDILAISKDRTRLLVIELKRGRASDVVVGQTLRYMGFVQDVMLEEGQSVEGLIIAQDDDKRIRFALSAAKNIRFMRYRVEFHLEP